MIKKITICGILLFLLGLCVYNLIRSLKVISNKSSKNKNNSDNKIEKYHYRRYQTVENTASWENWDSENSFNFTKVPVPWITNRINPTFNTLLSNGNINLYPFKIVTAQYLLNKGYLSSGDYIWSGSRGQNIFMYSINIPVNSKWAPIGDLFVASRNDPDLNNVPVVLIRNSKPFSIPMKPENYKWISDSWKCRNPGDLSWWGYQSSPDPNYNPVGMLISRFSKGSNPLDPNQRGNKNCVVSTINRKYLNVLGTNDQDGRWAVGNDSGSGCGNDHWFYMTSCFFTMGVNSNNSGWWFGNKPFYDFVPETIPRVTWFNKLLIENPSLKTYYKMEGPNQISLTLEYGGEILGTITEEDTSNIIKLDGNKVDIRQVIALFGPPPQSTSNWMTEFINRNPGVQKIKNRLKVVDRKLYIYTSDETPNYFKLDNFDVAGNDITCIRNNPTALSTCKNSCGGNPYCIAYNEIKPNGVWGGDYGCCTKTNNISNLKKTNNINFYIKDYSNSDYYQFDSFDAAGNDIQCYRNVDVDKCKQDCANNPNCVAYNEIKKNGAWGNDYGCCTKSSIDTLSSYPTINTYVKKTRYLGYVDDAHIGDIKMEDGTWIPIGDMFQLIAGPKETFRFTYMNNNEQKDYFDESLKKCKNMNSKERTNYIYENKEFFRYACWPWERCAYSWAEDLGNKIASGTMTAADWVKNRAEDVANFSKNAAIDVGNWAKNMSGDALNWAKGAGSFVVKNLVDIGNQIGNAARNAANIIKETATNTVNTIKTNVYDKGLKVAGNAIADGSVQAAMAVKKAAEQAINFLASFPEIARQAVNKAIEWLKGASSKVWDAIKQPLGLIINIILEGTHCEYKVQRDISKLDAIKAIEPALLPKLRIVVLEFVKSILNTASAGILTPILALIMPFVEPHIAPHIDGLLEKAVETNEATIAITTMADPIVNQVSKISCPFLNIPDTSDIIFNASLDTTDGNFGSAGLTAADMSDFDGL